MARSIQASSREPAADESVFGGRGVLGVPFDANRSSAAAHSGDQGGTGPRKWVEYQVSRLGAGKDDAFCKRKRHLRRVPCPFGRRTTGYDLGDVPDIAGVLAAGLFRKRPFFREFG